MTRYPVTVGPDMIICDATEIIGENGFRRVPVVDNERVVGILSAADVSIRVRTCDACMENLFSEVEKAAK